MNRRHVLASSAAVVGGLAGCLGDGSGDGEGTSAEGYPTQTFSGEDVPLAPLEDVYGWYESDEARFVDARSRSQFDDSRVAGAVYSPAPDGLESDDPVDGWPTDVRIVTYCRCPHLLAGERAASLLADGYESVYAIDEGFGAWEEAGYPVEGTEADLDAPAYEIRGRSDPSHAGEYVWIREPETDRREVSPVAADGTYELEVRFDGLTGGTVLEVDAPDYTLEAPLSELTDGVVTG